MSEETTIIVSFTKLTDEPLEDFIEDLRKYIQDGYDSEEISGLRVISEGDIAIPLDGDTFEDLLDYDG